MPYTEPPAIVHTLDERLGRPTVQAADVERAVGDLGEMLGLPASDVRSSPTLSQAALRLRDVTIHEIARRNEDQEKYHPTGERTGQFEFKSNSLLYRLEKPQPVEAVVCKLLRCPDPDLLVAQQVQSLAQANKDSPETYKALLNFADQIGKGSRDSKAVLDGKELIACLPGDSAGVVARRLAVASEAISTNGQDLNNLKLEAVRGEIEVARLFREALSLRFTAQVEAMNLPYEASIGRRIFAVSSVADVSRELAPLRSLQDRANSNKLLSEGDVQTIEALIGQARDLHLNARQEGALAAGVVAGLDRDVDDCLRAQHAAVLYGDQRIAALNDASVAVAWRQQRDEIVAQSRALVVREIGYRTEPPSDRELLQMAEQLATLTSASDAKLALAEGVSAAKGSVLLEPESGARTKKLRELERIEARLCSECLAAVGVEPPTFKVDTTKVTALSEREQHVACEALTRLLRDAFERHDGASRGAIERALKTFIDSATDPVVREAREFGALTSLAAFALEQPSALQDGSPLLQGLTTTTPGKERETLIAYLTAKYTELSDTRIATREILGKLSVGTPEYSRTSQDLLEVDRQFARCVTALQGGLAYDVTHAESSEQKATAFSKLEALLEPSRQDDLKALKEAQGERERLRGIVSKLAAAPGSSRDASLAIARGNLQVVETVIARLSDSIVWSAVYEAKVALEAHDPKLTERAKAIIKTIPVEVEMEPAAQRLVSAFKREHESLKLIALAKQFLYESVRDNPKNTYAFMIAFGLLGAAGAYATRRSSHLGFLLASSATLAATKALCVTTGLDSMAAAYSTGLTFSSQGSAALDLFYLVSDLTQVGLLFGAYRGLKKSEQEGLTLEWPKGRKEFLKVLRQEVAEYAKAGISQLDPRSLGFWLIGVPLTLGGYHIWTSGARPEEQLAQGVTLASEVVPILIIAILHDRIMARLNPDIS